MVLDEHPQEQMVGISFDADGNWQIKLMGGIDLATKKPVPPISAHRFAEALNNIGIKLDGLTDADLVG